MAELAVANAAFAPTAEQRERLAVDGFVIMRGIIRQQELPRLRLAADKLLAEQPAHLRARPSFSAGGGVAGAGGDTCLAELVVSDR